MARIIFKWTPPNGGEAINLAYVYYTWCENIGPWSTTKTTGTGPSSRHGGSRGPVPVHQDAHETLRIARVSFWIYGPKHEESTRRFGVWTANDEEALKHKEEFAS